MFKGIMDKSSSCLWQWQKKELGEHFAHQSLFNSLIQGFVKVRETISDQVSVNISVNPIGFS
jgi:hypothetical protein